PPEERRTILRIVKTIKPYGLLNNSSGIVYEFLRNSRAAFAALRALRSAPARPNLAIGQSA
ncbi:hypothetical protein, partial [Streptomyces rubiginosohelvolus]|uniref:hypothetical protein n=1 Tax=Streptomyces rubiginosohelvolus TaxID=67362 RepID=UPI00367C28E4